MVHPQLIESHEAFQARLAEAVALRQHIVASVPWSKPVLSLYAFAALTLPELNLPQLSDEALPEEDSADPLAMPPVTLVICQDADMLRLNMDILRHSHFTAPEVAMLDASQMPHEEREVIEWLNRGKVRLLLMTPERFTNLRLLALLARLNLRLIVIEDAHQLLPGFAGHERYKRLAATLRRFVSLPTVCLLTGPLGNHTMVGLVEMLGLPVAHLCRFATPLNQLAFHVHMPLTAHQQLSEIIGLFPAQQATSKVAKSVLAKPAGASIIRIYDKRMAFKLAAMLDTDEDTPVWQFPLPPNSGIADIRQLRQRMQETPNFILIDSSPPGRFLNWGAQASSHRLICWELPHALDALVMDGLRHGVPPKHVISPKSEANMGDATQIHVFYNRERYAEARTEVTRLLRGGERNFSAGGFNTNLHTQHALAEVRQWCLTDECRIVGLAKRVGYPAPGPCGQCDTCLDHPTPARGFLRQVVKQVLYS